MDDKTSGSEAPEPSGARAKGPSRVTKDVYVVRHGHALPRDYWSGPDEDRPLTDRGRKEAEALAGRFDTRPLGSRSGKSGVSDLEPRPTVLLSSGAERCLATLAPLAVACGLAVETAGYLAEGSDAGEVLVRARELAAGGAVPVLCTHGDVIWWIIELLEKGGAFLPGPVYVKKGSIWVLETDAGAIGSARYIPPAKV